MRAKLGRYRRSVVGILRFEQRNCFGKQLVREERRTGNLGFAIHYVVQVGLESLCVVLEKVLAVDVHAFGCDVLCRRLHSSGAQP